MEVDKIVTKYLEDGNNLFTVVSMDSIRDGGTICINTNSPTTKFYVNSKTKKLHYSYPTNDVNLVTDRTTILYLLHRIETYLNRVEDKLIRDKNTLSTLNKIIQ